MGAGIHGGFGNTRGAKESKIFQPVPFKGTVVVNGETRNVDRKVYQRHDIDFDYIDPDTGKTNSMLMSEGRAPIGNDGYRIQLHHVIQKEVGPVVEIRETTHKEYSRILHGLGETGTSFRNDPVLKKQYNNFRSAYWKWRAKQHIREKRSR